MVPHFWHFERPQAVGDTMTSCCFRGHRRLVLLFACAPLVAPAHADDVTVAALNRAAAEANCPKVDSRQNAVRATMCRMNATRPVLAEHAPATLPAFEKMAARNIASAKKFAAGQITGEQYMAEGKARAAEFLAETEQARQALERERLQEQCNRMANPWITRACKLPRSRSCAISGACVKIGCPLRDGDGPTPLDPGRKPTLAGVYLLQDTAPSAVSFGTTAGLKRWIGFNIGMTWPWHLAGAFSFAGRSGFGPAHEIRTDLGVFDMAHAGSENRRT
jgi:hypothetical protein